MNKELSQNIEIFIDKLGLELTQSGDNYKGVTVCHGGDNVGGLSIFLCEDGFYRWKCFTHDCNGEWGNLLVGLAQCILTNRTGKEQEHSDIVKFFSDSDLKSYAEFKKKFTDPKLLYALWKNIKAERVFRHLTSLKGVFLPVFLNDITWENVGDLVRGFTDEH